MVRVVVVREEADESRFPARRPSWLGCKVAFVSAVDLRSTIEGRDGDLKEMSKPKAEQRTNVAAWTPDLLLSDRHIDRMKTGLLEVLAFFVVAE